MHRPLRWYDYITINAYWFALTARSQTLTPLIIPLLVQSFVGEAAKGTYVGIIRLWALMVAVLVQALMGIISDRSQFRWGRRRPFIAIGTLAEMFVFVCIGAISSLEGMLGYWILFTLYILSMLATNTAHAATQGLIPDLVPDDKKGLFSGIKTLLELPLPMIFVSLVIGRMIARGNLWGGLFTLAVAMLICMATSLFVPESPSRAKPPPLDWRPFQRLAMMTVAFTVVILGTGEAIKLVLRATEGLSGNSVLLLVGVAGLIGMGFAAVVGVLASIRIGLGDEFRHNRSFAWWVINRLICLVASTNLGQFMVYFLQERFADLQGQKAVGPAANVVMFVGLFMLLLALPSGWLADRISKKWLIAASASLSTIGTFIVVLVPNMLAVYIGGCFVGAGVGIFYSASWALGTKIVPQERAGQFLGLSNLAGAGAGAIGAYIGGPLADKASYTLLLAIYGILFLSSILALWGIREKTAQPGRS